jgi:hypothetical protein
LDGVLGNNSNIDHQPLIHVKVRVVEVQRSNALSVSSVLDYISRDGNDPALVTGVLNGKNRNLSGITRFAIPGLVSNTDRGAGMLVNLTSRHINWVASFLADEFNGDIITAPQVTTLNGQNVEFVAGAKVPFEIGQNIVGVGSNNIQQFFYKHVGTYISVTPQIVHWGQKHNGRGSRLRADYEHPLSVQVADIVERRRFIETLRDLSEQTILDFTGEDAAAILFARELPAVIKDTDLVSLIQLLNQKIRNSGNPEEIIKSFGDDVLDKQRLYMAYNEEACPGCHWEPNDCTIDLEIVVRLSGQGAQTVQDPDRDGEPDEAATREINIEDNVRAISNIVQVKSGHGVVMGGLIGMRDVEVMQKTPILGDLPYAGFLFRSKQTDRAKTETLIFVEATVLASDPDCMKAASAEDFCNAKQHLYGGICDSDLHEGMYRAGLTTPYLPQPTHGEVEYWREYHQQMSFKRRRMSVTAARDMLE